MDTPKTQNMSTIESIPEVEVGFSVEYLRRNLGTLEVSVHFENCDFLEKQFYKVEFRNDGRLFYEVDRRYNEFYALYKVIQMNFKNIELKQFPGKYQIFNKIETRQKYFQDLLSTLLLFASEHGELRNRVLATLVSFCQMKTRKNSATLSDDNRSISGLSELSVQQMRYQSQADTNHLIGRLLEHSRISNDSKQDDNYMNNHTTLINNKQPLEHSAGDTILQGSNSMMTDALRNKNNNYVYLRLEGEEEWRKKYIKIKGSVLELYRDISRNEFETKIELYGIKIEYLRPRLSFVDHCLYKFEIEDEERVYPGDLRFLSLFHEYDEKKLILTVPQAVERKLCPELDDIKRKLEVASKKEKISQDYVGIFSPIGKVYLIFYRNRFLKNRNNEELGRDGSSWLIRVRSSTFAYDTRKFLFNEEVRIKQSFIIPVSNAFEEFRIELVRVSTDGWISQKIKEDVEGLAVINMNDMLSYNSDYTFEKLQVRLLDPLTDEPVSVLESTVRNCSAASSIYSQSFASENDGKIIAYETHSSKETINTLVNTIDRMLYVIGTVAITIMTAWRNIFYSKYPRLSRLVWTILALTFLFADMNNILKFVIGSVLAMVVYYQPTVYQITNEVANAYLIGRKHLHPDFKEPRILSKAQFKFLSFSHYFLNEKRLKQEQRQKELSKNVARGGADTVESKMQHTLDNFKSILLRKGQDEKKIEKEEQGLFSKLKQAKNIIEDIHNILHSVVNVIEKIMSLYTWTDRKRTGYFLVVVVLAYFLLTNAIGIRLVLAFVCVHRMIKGITFYKKLYRGNRALAFHCVKYVINQWFPELGRFSDSDTENALVDVYFSCEQNFLKKFKKEIEKLLPICFNVSEILELFNLEQDMTKMQVEELQYKKFVLNRYYREGDRVSIYFILDLIESCESKLSLEKVITAEGRTPEYTVPTNYLQYLICYSLQKLKTNTRETPVIDIWLEDLLKNFILNLPSKEYEIVYRRKPSDNPLFQTEAYPHRQKAQ